MRSKQAKWYVSFNNLLLSNS